MNYKIALIPGDGIGPEIVAEAKKVLDKVCEVYGHSFSYEEVLLGGASIDVHGVPLTEEAIKSAKASDAVLMGSIGGDAKTSPWYQLEPSKRPEAGLLAIRKALNLFANLRPAYLYEELKGACPLKEEVIGDGFDMIIVRELTADAMEDTTAAARSMATARFFISLSPFSLLLLPDRPHHGNLCPFYLLRGVSWQPPSKTAPDSSAASMPAFFLFMISLPLSFY